MFNLCKLIPSGFLPVREDQFKFLVVLIDVKTGQRYSVVVCISYFPSIRGCVSPVSRSTLTNLWITTVRFQFLLIFRNLTKYNQGCAVYQLLLVSIIAI